MDASSSLLSTGMSLMRSSHATLRASMLTVCMDLSSCPWSVVAIGATTVYRSAATSNPVLLSAICILFGLIVVQRGIDAHGAIARQAAREEPGDAFFRRSNCWKRWRMGMRHSDRTGPHHDVPDQRHRAEPHQRGEHDVHEQSIESVPVAFFADQPVIRQESECGSDQHQDDEKCEQVHKTKGFPRDHREDEPPEQNADGNAEAHALFAIACGSDDDRREHEWNDHGCSRGDCKGKAELTRGRHDGRGYGQAILTQR